MAKKIVLLALAFLLGCTATYLVLGVVKPAVEALSYYAVQGRSFSPDGNFRMTEFQSGKKDVYIVLSEASSPELAENGYLIYQGSCLNALKYSWVDNRSVRVECNLNPQAEPEFIGSTAYGISIRYVYKKNS